MARQDFFLQFGSDADQFGQKLRGQLGPARKEIALLAKDVEKLDKAMAKRTGGGGIDGLVRGLGEANTLVESLVESLGGLGREFQSIANALKSASSAMSGVEPPRPAPGVETGKSHAGRASKTAVRSTGRDLPQDADAAIQDYLETKRSLEEANRKLAEVTTSTGRAKRGQKDVKTDLNQQVREKQDRIDRLRKQWDQLEHDYADGLEQAAQRLSQEGQSPLENLLASTTTEEPKRPAKKATKKTATKKPGGKGAKEKGEAAKEQAQQVSKKAEEVTRKAREFDELLDLANKALEEGRIEEFATKDITHQERVRMGSKLGMHKRPGKGKPKIIGKEQFAERLPGALEKQRPSDSSAEQVLEEVAEQEAEATEEVVNASLEEAVAHRDALLAKQAALREERGKIAVKKGRSYQAKDPKDKSRVKEIRSELKELDPEAGEAIRQVKALESQPAKETSGQAEDVGQQLEGFNQTKLREVANSLGIGIIIGEKNEELRARIQEAIQGADTGDSGGEQDVRQQVEALAEKYRQVAQAIKAAEEAGKPVEDAWQELGGIYQEIVNLADEGDTQQAEEAAEALIQTAEEAAKSNEALKAALAKAAELDLEKPERLSKEQNEILRLSRKTGGEDFGRRLRDTETAGRQRIAEVPGLEMDRPDLDMGRILGEDKALVDVRGVSESLGGMPPALEQGLLEFESFGETLDQLRESYREVQEHEGMAKSMVGDDPAARDQILEEYREERARIRDSINQVLEERRQFLNDLINEFPVASQIFQGVDTRPAPTAQRTDMDQVIREREQELEKQTRDQLREQAREAEIPGRGSMRKSDLVHRLARHQPIQEEFPPRPLLEHDIATRGVRDLPGLGGSIQPLPETVRGRQSTHGALTEDQMAKAEAARQEEARIEEENRLIAERNQAKARETAQALREAMPEASVKQMRQALGKDKGVTKQAASVIMQVVELLDRIAAMEVGRDSAAGKRIEQFEGGRERRTEESLRKRGLTPDQPRGKRARAHLRQRDVRGAVRGAFFDPRQTAGEKRGTVEQQFRVKELREQAKTPEARGALERFEDSVGDYTARAKKRMPPPVDELEGQLRELEQQTETTDPSEFAAIQERIEARKRIAELESRARREEDPEEKSRLEEHAQGLRTIQDQTKAEKGSATAKWDAINKQIETRKRIDREETELWKQMLQRYEAVHEAIGGSAEDPEVMEQRKERRRHEEARAEEGLPRQPLTEKDIRARVEKVDPEFLAKRLGTGFQAFDPADMENANRAIEEAEAKLAAKREELQTVEQRDPSARETEAQELANQARQAWEAVQRAEEEAAASAPMSDRLRQAKEEYESLTATRWKETGERAEGLEQAHTRDELLERARETGVKGRSRMDKSALAQRLARDEFRDSDRGRELDVQRDEAWKRVERIQREEPTPEPEPIDPALRQEAEEKERAAKEAAESLRLLKEEIVRLSEEARGAERLLESRKEGRRHLESREPEGEVAQKFHRLQDLIGRIESGEIERTGQISMQRREEFGLKGESGDAPDIETLRRARLGLVKKQIEDLPGFRSDDKRFTDPNMAIEELIRHFENFARGIQENPDEAVRQELEKAQKVEEEKAPRVDERVQRARAEEAAKTEAKMQHTKEPVADSFSKCCERIIAALNRIHETLRTGVRITGKGPATRSGPTRKELEQQAKDLNIRGRSRMDKAQLAEAVGGAQSSERAVEAERQLQVQRDSTTESTALAAESARSIRRDELPESARQFLSSEDLMPEDTIERARKFTEILSGEGFTPGQARKHAVEQFGLSDEDAERLKSRIQTIEAAGRREAESRRQASEDKQAGFRAENELLEYQQRILNALGPETRKAVEEARRLKALSPQERAGREDEILGAQTRATQLLKEGFDRESGGQVFASAGDKRSQMRKMLGVSDDEFRTIYGNASGEAFAQGLEESTVREAPNFQQTMGNAFFGQSGFMSRMMRSTGTFMVRQLSAGMVFGMSRMVRTLLREAIQTEAQFVRVSDALEATGRTAAGVRTELMRISTEIGTPLQEMYDIASNITGAFEDVRDVEFGSRIVAQLELISQGSLTAAAGFDALQTIAAAFELEGVRELERIQDTAVAIQNVMAIGVGDTIEGIGGMAGQAAELNMGLEQTAVLVAAVSKGTNQAGKAAAEQFGRILTTFETQKGRNVLLEAGIGERGMFTEGMIGDVVFDMIENWDNLTDSQQRNIKATFGARREGRAFNALINRREQILQTLIETENAHGLGQQRVSEIMREIASQIRITSANFTNFGAVLVRSGVLDFFGVILKGVNTALGGLNEFLGMMNDLADSNPLARFARDSIGLMIGLTVAIKSAGMAMDMAAGAMLRQATAAGTAQAAMAMPIMGRRMQRIAAQQGGVAASGAAAGAVAGRGAGFVTLGMGGAMAGAAARRGRRQPSHRLGAMDPSGRGLGALDAALLGAAAGSGFGGRRGEGVGRFRRTFGVQHGLPARGAERLGNALQRRGAQLAGTNAIRQTGFGAIGARGAAGIGTGVGAKAGGGMAALGGVIAGLGPKAWALAAALAAVGGVAASITEDSRVASKQQRAGFDLNRDMLTESTIERVEEAQQKRDMSWFRRWTERGRDAREEAARERHEELQEMDPAERMLSEFEDRSNWSRARGIIGGAARSLPFIPGSGRQSVREAWNPGATARKAYEEEMERLENEMLIGTRQGQGGVTLGDFGDRISSMFDVDDDGNINVRGSMLPDSQEDRLAFVASERQKAELAFVRDMESLQRAFDEGEISEQEFAGKAAALNESRRLIRDKIQSLERGVLGLRDIDHLMADELESFLDAVGFLEGVGPRHLGEIEGALDVLFEDLMPEGSSWEQTLDRLMAGGHSDREFLEELQGIRRASLDEAIRILDEMVGDEYDEEEIDQQKQVVRNLAQEYAQGEQQLWENARSTAQEMAQIAAEMGGDSVLVAEQAIGEALASLQEELGRVRQGSVEWHQLMAQQREITSLLIDIYVGPLEREFELADAQSQDSLAAAQRAHAVAQQRLTAAENLAHSLGLRGEQRDAFLHDAQLMVFQAEQQEASAIEQLARSHLELSLSQTRDPRVEAMLRLQAAQDQLEAYSGGDAGEIASLEAAINDAENQLIDQARAERDARAQRRIAGVRDPEIRLLREMELARVQLAEAAEEGTAAYQQALQNLEDLERQLEDERRAIRMQQFQTRIVSTEDPLRQARLQAQQAAEEMRQAVGQQDRLGAQQSIVAAATAEVEAISAIASSQLDLAQAIAQAYGSQIDVARLQLAAAQRQLREVQARGQGDAAIAQARAQVINAEAQMRDAVLQDHLDTIEFNREMGVITQGEAIQSLQTILQEMELTRDQRRQLHRQIKGLQDDLRAQLTGSGFNIPTEIDLPTAYMVRRSLGIDEVRGDRLPEGYEALTRPELDLDADLTNPLSDWEDAVGTSTDSVVKMAREGAKEAIAAILDEHRDLRPKMDDALSALSAAQEEAWRMSREAAGNGAQSTNALSLETIKELSPAMQDELANLAKDHTRAWSAAREAADAGAKSVTDTVEERMSDGVSNVAQIVLGFAAALAGGINPLLEALGEPQIKPGRHIVQALPGQAHARGGVRSKLPNNATIETPHGAGLVQWAEDTTHGEAFIPLSPANRPRSLEIWKETGRRLGVESTESFAAGGLRSPNYDRTSGGTVYYGGWTRNLAPYVIHDVARILNATPGAQGISSAYRSPTHNQRVGGAPDSDHMQGHAVDIIPLGPQLDAAIRQFQALPQVRWVSPPGHYRSHRHVSWQRRGFTPNHSDPIDMAPFALGADSAGPTLGFPSFPEIPETPEGLLGDIGTAVMEHMLDLAFQVHGQGMDSVMGATGSMASGELQQMVRKRMRAFGWGDEHWPALKNLIQRESSWNPNAQNQQGSSAYGLFQFLDTTWAGTGIAKTSDPGLQTEAGLRYIRNRYGDPSAAWRHWLARVPINGQDMGHWYRQGGIFDQPSIIGVGEAGPEAVIPLDQRGARFMAQLVDESASRAATRTGAGGDVDVRQFLREMGQLAGQASSPNSETNVSIENTFHQVVSSPAMVEQVARRVVDLLGRQMGGAARSSQVTPHLVRQGR